MHLIQFGHPDYTPEERASEEKIHLKVSSFFCFCGGVLLAFLAPSGPMHGCVTAAGLHCLPAHHTATKGQRETVCCLRQKTSLRMLRPLPLEWGRVWGLVRTCKRGDTLPLQSRWLHCASTRAPALACAASCERSAIGLRGGVGGELSLGALPAPPADRPRDVTAPRTALPPPTEQQPLNLNLGPED